MTLNARFAPMALISVILLAAAGADAQLPPNRSVAAPLPSGTAVDASVLDSLDARVPGWLRQFGVPSIGVAYIRDGRVAWTRVYGEQSAGVPATERTLFNVASLTKPVFAETVLRLVATGVLTLDDPMASAWIDPDVAADPRHTRLTPRLALSHRTGFPNWRRETSGTLRFKHDPGEKYSYSGEGFEYLKEYTRRKTQQSIDSSAQALIFAPAGLRNISFTAKPWFAGRVAMPQGPGGKWRGSDSSSREVASDNLHTTVADYAGFVVSVMRRDGLPAALISQRDSLHSVDTPGKGECDSRKVPTCPVNSGYGLGWSVFEYPDDKVLWHTGSDWGEKAMVFYSVGKRDGMVMLTNGVNGFSVIIEVGTLVMRGRPFGDFLAGGRR